LNVSDRADFRILCVISYRKIEKNSTVYFRVKSHSPRIELTDRWRWRGEVGDTAAKVQGGIQALRDLMRTKWGITGIKLRTLQLKQWYPLWIQHLRPA